MRVIIALILGFFLIFTPQITLAHNIDEEVDEATISVDYALPYPGLLPDHPLYVIKVMRDRILEWFTKDPVKLVEIQLLFADKRLRMGEMLMDKGKNELALSTVSKGEKYLQKAVGSYRLIRRGSKANTNSLYDNLVISSFKHIEVIQNMMVKDSKRREEWQKLADFTRDIHEEIEGLK